MGVIKPNEKYLDEYLAACKESYDYDVKEWMPVELDDFDNWKTRALRLCEMLECGDGLPEGIPRMITYWCVEQDKFIGEIQIRPFLSVEEAKVVGHIGYAVRYSMWNKGYGTKLLTYAVERLQEMNVNPIYIACHIDNEGSNRVSQKVGFQFVETRGVGEDKENVYVLHKK